MSLQARIQTFPGQVSFYAKNLNTGKTVGWHEHEVMPSASLIKVPILAELFRRVEEESLSLDDTVTVRLEDQVPGSGVLKDLTPNTRYALRDVATLMITVSDNTATNLLIDYLGVPAVNTLIRRLGLLHTVLERRLERLPVERSQVNRTSSADMTRLMELIAEGQVVSVDVCRRLVDVLMRCQAPQSLAPTPKNTTTWVGQTPSTQVAHKTGSLDQARHDSGIIYHANQVMVATIMSQGAPEATLQNHIDRIGLELFRQLK